MNQGNKTQKLRDNILEVIALRIRKVRKNEDGDIIAVMLENGQTMDIQQAVQQAEMGNIHGVNVGVAKNGRKYLRSNPDGSEENNLDNLPEF